MFTCVPMHISRQPQKLYNASKCKQLNVKDNQTQFKIPPQYLILTPAMFSYVYPQHILNCLTSINDSSKFFDTCFDHIQVPGLIELRLLRFDLCHQVHFTIQYAMYIKKIMITYVCYTLQNMNIYQLTYV